MSLVEKKENLMHIVKDADEKLTGLLIALADEYNTPDYEYSEEEIQSFYKTRDEFFASGEKGKTVEEAHNEIRRKYQNGL